ncbi:MAG: chromosome segregation protein SMC [Candidatus Nanopelagicales bacterium]
MHLKSLTLKGFKSFASATTLQFEPGVTCVVGPNGSGKSNVVDALAWVMGEQGAKSLRGGKMEDVIFSGTAGRAPLGRAEVAVTIDNSDGALPIEFSEVTISRTLFRNGGSEYAINGEQCRLLDVQELLSDSGIGREMHVIVGQGQLDSILKATPEDRRGFIEEAAGVLKHRKRKEKALRKLDSMQANLTRLNDLTAELRRALKPLGRQAEVARRATVIQSDVRDSRLRLMANDLCELRLTLEAEVADESALRERQSEVESKIATLRERESNAEELERELGPELIKGQETWFALSSLRERYLGLVQLGVEKVQNLAPEPEEEKSGREPEALEAEARSLRSQEFELTRKVEALGQALSQAEIGEQGAERALSQEASRVAEIESARVAHVKKTDDLKAARDNVGARLETRESELTRLNSQIGEAQERSQQAQAQFQQVEVSVISHGAGEEGLDSEHEASQEILAGVDTKVRELLALEAKLDREKAAGIARRDALALGLERKDGSAALVDSGLAGYIGTLSSLIQVEHGYEAAVASALGNLSSAVVVSNVDLAMDALVFLKTEEAGRSNVLVAEFPAPPVQHDRQAPAGRWLVDCLRVDPIVSAQVHALLNRFVVVDSLEEMRQSARRNLGVSLVSRQGDSIDAGVIEGGSSSSPSLLEVQAVFDECESALAQTVQELQRVIFDLAATKNEQEVAAHRVESALTLLHESDAELAAIAEKLGALGQLSRNALAEAERVESAMLSTQAADARDRELLATLTAQLDTLQQQHVPTIGEDRREACERELTQARSNVVDSRLAVRTAEERVRAIGERAAALERDAQSERSVRIAALERRERRAKSLIVAQALLAGARVALTYTETSVGLAQRSRSHGETLKKERDTELVFVRAEVRTLVDVLENLKDTVHRDEVARAEQRMRIESLEMKALEDFGFASDELLAEYGPEQLVPPSPAAPGDEIDPDAPLPEPYPFVRDDQEKRLRVAEKQLALLGKVNPLALEEYSAMEERQLFLTEQLEDLKKTRDDLLDIVKEVDARVERVFTEAYTEIAREFEGVFSRLFPGGEGRLVLTDPDNMLTTGVDVEARPPGKKIKRLSLLSGGERSLTAVAFLVALFKARPSPFYVLDEVEAALDDVNLGRLIDIIEELRSTSQLIVITHQKRTMEIADALYGVSMRGDGVTQIIGQRLREAEPA